MAQQQNSPSMPQQGGRNHQAHAVNSDNDVPIDPSIAAPSPTYPYGQHSPYATNPDMTHSYSHPSSGMYAQPRPDWTGYGQHGGAPLTPGHPMYTQQPASAPPQRSNQVRVPCPTRRRARGGTWLRRARPAWPWRGLLLPRLLRRGMAPTRAARPDAHCPPFLCGLTGDLGVLVCPDSRRAAA